MTLFLNLICGSCIFLGTLPSACSWRLRLQKDDRVLDPEKRKQMESKIQELAKKLEINKPIELIEKKGISSGAQAQGVSMFPVRAGIAINPEFVETISDTELEFVLAHELSHIKTNDLIWMGLVPSIIGFITVIALSILLPLIAVYAPIVALAGAPALVGLAVSCIAFIIFSKWREKRADQSALSVCSDAAKAGASNFFQEMKTYLVEVRNNKKDSYFSRLCKRFFITKDGEMRLDLFHPSLKSRIDYLKTY